MRIKPHGAPRQKRTEKQDAATQRNMRIFQLRGLYSHTYLLTAWRRKIAQWLVDDELARMGAKTEAERTADREAAWALADYLDKRREEMFAEIPF